MAKVTANFNLLEALEVAYDNINSQEVLLSMLVANSRKNADERQLKGGVLSFPVADGLAYYLVLNDTDPLELAWLAVGDYYAVPAWQLQGLDSKLALNLMIADSAINRVFHE
jgi:hypothetical protein